MTTNKRLPKTFLWRGLVLDRWTNEWTGYCRLGPVFATKTKTGRYCAWIVEPKGHRVFHDTLEEALEGALRTQIESLIEHLIEEKSWVEKIVTWIGATNAGT